MTETGWLVLGANGQLGRALQTQLAARDDVTFWTRDEADLANPLALKEALLGIQPTAIINASAYTAVDKAEDEPELAQTVNGDSVGVMAEYAKARGIALVHYSTDYVFDGSGDRPWREDDEPAPLNAYGRSKLLGEQAIADSGCKHLIFRTSWVYDGQGKNFLTTMLRLGAQRETLKIVADQIGAPTYAPHLARVSMQAFEQALAAGTFASGIYHLAGGGQPVSWYNFACRIFDHARLQGVELAVQDVGAIASSEYPTPAARPLNSRLSMTKFERTFECAMPDWEDGLKEALAEDALK